MIYYLDTSALVKRYVAEPGSAAVRGLFRRRRQVAVSRVGFAELAAAIARLAREGALDPGARDGLLARLAGDFADLLVVEVRSATLRDVPALVVGHPLRGFDAVHLAAALTLRREGAAVDFWSADARLVAAARAEGLRARAPG